MTNVSLLTIEPVVFMGMQYTFGRFNLMEIKVERRESRVAFKILEMAPRPLPSVWSRILADGPA